jgi:hypothetical protein
MSVWDYMYDSYWIQRNDISNLQRSNQVMRSKSIRDGARIRNLEDEIDHLTLINEALLRMLEKKGVFTRDEYRSLLVEVDLEDGVHDGKLAHPAPSGDTPAPLPANQTHCKFCKTANDPANTFCVHCRRPLMRR